MDVAGHDKNEAWISSRTSYSIRETSHEASSFQCQKQVIFKDQICGADLSSRRCQERQEDMCVLSLGSREAWVNACKHNLNMLHAGRCEP